MFTSLNARALGLPLDAAETIAQAARAGFGGVDLMVRDLVEAGDDPAGVRGRMDDLGLRGGAWPLPVAWRGDEPAFMADLARLPGLAEAAATLGLARTCTWVMPDRDPAVGPETLFDLHVRRLSAIARTLADHGTRLGLEVIGVASFRRPGFGAFVARLGDLGPLLDAIASEAPTVGVVADAFHLFAADEPLDAPLAWGADRVVWAHVADLPAGDRVDRLLMRDERRGLPGENGAFGAAGMLDALMARGYNGPVTAEPMPGWAQRHHLSATEAVDRVAASLRGCWPPALSGSGPLGARSRPGGPG